MIFSARERVGFCLFFFFLSDRKIRDTRAKPSSRADLPETQPRICSCPRLSESRSNRPNSRLWAAPSPSCHRDARPPRPPYHDGRRNDRDRRRADDRRRCRPCPRRRACTLCHACGTKAWPYKRRELARGGGELTRLPIKRERSVRAPPVVPPFRSTIDAVSRGSSIARSRATSRATMRSRIFRISPIHLPPVCWAIAVSSVPPAAPDLPPAADVDSASTRLDSPQAE